MSIAHQELAERLERTEATLAGRIQDWLEGLRLVVVRQRGMGEMTADCFEALISEFDWLETDNKEAEGEADDRTA